MSVGLIASVLLGQASSRALSPMAPKLIAAARAQVGVTVSYDPAYVKLKFPGGDVPKNTGVCTDVIIRALRTQGVDLQALVNRDMRKAFSAYPRKWGLKRTDPNIDHRRVPNLQTFLARRGKRAAKPFRPGDIVTWKLDTGQDHIGILTDRKRADGDGYLAVHNIGAGAQEEDILYRFKITGHYRWFSR